MTGQGKTNQELVKEISILKQRIRELEKSESKSNRAGEVLHQSEKRFRTLFELIPFACMLNDMEGRFLMVNEAFSRLTGYRTEEALGRTPTELGLIAPINDMSTLMTELAEGKVYTAEIKGRNKTGKDRQFIYSSRMIDAETPPLILTVTVDITEHMRAEEALRESRKRYSMLSKASFEGIIISEKGMIVNANDQLAHMLGYELSEIIGTDGLGFILPEHRELVRQHVLSGSESPYELPVRRKDGAVIHVEMRTKAHHTKGRITRLTALLDITERKRMAETLLESETLFRATFEHAAVGIAHVSLEGRFIRVNQRFCDIVGYGREEMLTLTFQDITYPDDLEADLNNIRQVTEGLIDTFSREKRYIRKDGLLVWANLTVALLRKAAGEPMYLISAIEDITKRKEADKALRESEELYRTLVETSPDSILMYTLDGTILSANTQLARSYGTSSVVEFLREVRSVFDLVTEEGKAFAAANFRRTITEGFSEKNEYQVRLRDGKTIPVEINSSVVRTGDGKPRALISVVRNISTRKEADKALRESEEKYRDLVENANSIILRMNADGMITFFNKYASIFFGFSHDEIIGRNVVGTIVPLTDSAGKDLARMILDIGVHPERYQNNENENICRDGTRVWVAWTNKPILDDHGRCVEILCVGNDITERKRIAVMLQQNEERYRSIVEALPDLLVRIDAENRFIDLQTRKPEQLPIPPDQVIGKRLEEIFPPFTAELIKGKVKETLDSGKIQIFEYSLTIKDEERYFESRMTKSGANSVLAIERDITERRRAEEEVRAAREQLIQADKMIALGTLVAGVAHEINNPNNFVMLNTPLIQEIWKGVLPILEEYYRDNGDFKAGGMSFSKVREGVPILLSAVLDGARRISSIVKELKDFARPDEVSMNQKVDINAVVKASVSLLQNLINKSTKSCEVTYGENLPALTGNFQRLEQVFINLIHNACQALPDNTRGIQIATSYDGQSIAVTVKDEGTGISIAHLNQIMDPFFTTRRGSGGTGLGLSISRRIITDHGGRIDVTSRVGAGSTFTVLLPLTPALEKTKILIADDDTVICDIMSHALLGNPAYEVIAVKSGTEACIMLGKWRPDLIVLDINMPDMNGVEVCRRIKSDPDFSTVKVIIVTGYADGMEMEEIRRMGFTDVLPKPFKTTEELQAFITAVLNKESSRQKRADTGLRH